MSGKLKYIPDEFLKEMEEIKKETGILGDSDIFREIKKYSKKGRQIEKIINFDELFNQKQK